MADSYVTSLAREAGFAAEKAATHMSAKYTDIDTNCIFQPIALESVDIINASGRDFCPN